MSETTPESPRPHSSSPELSPHHTRLWIIGVSIVSLILTITFGVFAYRLWTRDFTGKSHVESLQPSQVSNEAIAQKPPLIKPNLIHLNSLFVGDVFWGRYMQEWSQNSSLKTAYPFSGLNTFNRGEYQAWIGNLECPVTNQVISSAEQERLLKLNCLPEYMPEAAQWFNAFSMANNHSDNMQEVDGFAQTRKTLEENKLQYFGHFDNAVKSDICEVVSLPGKAEFPASDNPQDTQNHAPSENILVPVALCGFHDVFKLPTEDQLAVISDYAQYLPTIIMPHQGVEYASYHDPLQQSYFRKMIDNGADAVLGGHTHSVQDTEAYQGKLIVYSMGNFMFDQQGSAGVRTGMGVNLDFSFKNDDNFQKWTTLAEQCKMFHDTCLEQAKTQNLHKPSFNLKYGIVASDDSDKLTKKANDVTLQSVLKTTNWATTQPKLKTEL